MLFVSLIFWGLFYALFYIIPSPKRTNYCPNNETTGVPEESSMEQLNLENLSWMYEEKSLTITFFLCALCICVGEFLQSPTSSVADALTLKVLGKDDIHKYGWQRSWGSIGMAINSLVAGYLLSSQRWTESICNSEVSFSKYWVLSVLVSVFILLCMIGSYFITGNNTSKVSADEDVTDRPSTLTILKLFMSLHYGSWIVSVFYMGYCNGTAWGFVFWHLDNLGGSQLLMGIDYLCMNIAETIAFCTASLLIERIGHMGVVYISLLIYSLRFALYASLVNPWWVIPIDILQGLTISISWISFVSYSTLMVPVASLATIQGIIHGVLYGLGNGLGHLISGVFIEYYGAVWTFYGMSVASFVAFIGFFICQMTSKKPALENFSLKAKE